MYIELKDYNDYLEKYNINQADLLYEILSKNGIGDLPADGSDPEIGVII